MTKADRIVIIQLFRMVLRVLYALIAGAVRGSPEGLHELNNMKVSHNEFFAELEKWYDS